MKPQLKLVVALLLLPAFGHQFATVVAQGTAFTYQGQLSAGGAAVTGSYDLTFTLFGASSAGTAIASPVTNSAVAVSNGLFSLTLDFGDQFDGSALWLQIGVRPSGGGAFSTLAPRQKLTPAPYAITAENLAGVVNYNTNTGQYAAVGGGYANNAVYEYATVAGGYLNSASAWGSAVGGGAENTASSPDGSATVSGGFQNTASGDSSAVGGGANNSATNSYATVVGGNLNIAGGSGSAVGGGVGNSATGPDGYATVSGGYENTASGDDSTVGGGHYNTASTSGAAVGGGDGNIASAGNTAIAGGYFNTASGNAATVPGGSGNVASGAASFAAGHEAMAVNDGAFVWSDYSGGSFSSTAANQFAVSAAGGVVLAADVAMLGGANSYHNFSLSGGNALGYLYGSYPALGDGIHLGYNYYYDNSGNGHVSNTGGATSRLTTGYGFVGIYIGAVNGAPMTQRLLADSTGVTVNGTFNNSSDRNLKQDFADISPAQILEKVGQLPITEWSYKEDPRTRHVGPVAQDFYSTFNIGTDNKHIAPIDEGGVALAAIKGLNQKVEEQRVALQQKETEVTELKARMEMLEQLINARSGGGK